MDERELRERYREWEAAAAQQTPGRLNCAACRRPSVGKAAGWLAFLGAEDDDRLTVEVFCPVCALREFGPPR